MFDSPGYELKFVQRSACNDGSEHLFTSIFKFYSPVTGYWYILRTEYHHEDVFAVKFYTKQHRGSDFKYSKVVNKGDVQNILVTCIKVIPLLLKGYPDASFGFVGTRPVNDNSEFIENASFTQRFRIYMYLAALRLGDQTFDHFAYDDSSAYLLVNTKNTDTEAKAKAIFVVFQRTYVTAPDVL